MKIGVVSQTASIASVKGESRGQRGRPQLKRQRRRYPGGIVVLEKTRLSEHELPAINGNESESVSMCGLQLYLHAEARTETGEGKRSSEGLGFSPVLFCAINSLSYLQPSQSNSSNEILMQAQLEYSGIQLQNLDSKFFLCCLVAI